MNQKSLYELSNFNNCLERKIIIVEGNIRRSFERFHLVLCFSDKVCSQFVNAGSKNLHLILHLHTYSNATGLVNENSGGEDDSRVDHMSR